MTQVAFRYDYCLFVETWSARLVPDIFVPHFRAFLRLFWAVVYLDLQGVGGEAAQIAGLSRLQFETVLAENSLPNSTLSVADVLADIQKLG